MSQRAGLSQQKKACTFFCALPHLLHTSRLRLARFVPALIEVAKLGVQTSHIGNPKVGSRQLESNCGPNSNV